MLAKLKEIENTPEGNRWPGATWPSEQAFIDARIFIEHLPLTAIPLPSIGLADDGEINFLWATENVQLDLGFYGTGDYSFFAKGRGDKKIFSDSVAASEGMLDEVKELFTA